MHSTSTTPRGTPLDRATLDSAARAFLRIHAAGLTEALRDELAVVRREYRDRDEDRWHAQLSAGLPAMDLANLLQQSRSECERAVYLAMTPDWSAVAAGAIVDFASRMNYSRQGVRLTRRTA